jgi:urease accessory protein UreH
VFLQVNNNTFRKGRYRTKTNFFLQNQKQVWVAQTHFGPRQQTANAQVFLVGARSTGEC